MIRSYQGHWPQIPTSCYVDVSAQVLGDVTLGENSSVWCNAVLRGDVNSIRVGANSNVQDCCVLHGQRNLYSVTVGDWVTIGHNATVHGCTVEDAVLIGMGVTILNDCRIGEGSIIAAGAVLPEHHRGAAAHALGRRTGKAAPRAGRRGPQDDSRIREELSGLHENLPGGDRESREEVAEWRPTKIFGN